MNEEATAGEAVEETSAKSAPKAFPMSKPKKTAAIIVLFVTHGPRNLAPGA